MVLDGAARELILSDRGDAGEVTGREGARDLARILARLGQRLNGRDGPRVVLASDAKRLDRGADGACALVGTGARKGASGRSVAVAFVPLMWYGARALAITQRT